jgi:putative cell wall-binding protein
LRYRTHRLRRLAAAVALGVGMVGGVIGVTAGTAGAVTTTAVAGSFKSPNGATTSIPAGTTKNQVIGTLVLTVSRTVTKTKFLAQTVKLTVKDTTAHVGSYTAFTAVNSVAHLAPSNVGPGFVSTACTLTTKTNTHFSTAATAYKSVTCQISKTAGTVTAHGKTATAVFTWRTLRVESITGQGKVNVAAADLTGYGTAPTHVTYTFTPPAATAATYGVAAPTTPFKVLLNNLTTRPVPPAGLGTVGSPAGSWSLTLTSGALTKTHPATPTYNPNPTARGVLGTGHVQITVEPHTGHSTCVGTKTVAFDGLPKVTVTSATGTTVAATKIKISAALSGNNGCTGFFAPNVLTVIFATTVHFTKATAFIKITITTVKYSVAPKTATGTVTVSDKFYKSSTTPKTTFTNHTTTTTPGHITTSTNAIVSAAYVHVGTVKTIAPTSYDQAIGTVSVVESAAGSVSKGYVCLTLVGSTRTSTGTGIHGHTGTHHATGRTTHVPPSASFYGTMAFNTTAGAPTIKVTSGNGAVGTAAFVTPGVAAETLEFQVTSASTLASTYTVSGLFVNSNTHTTRRPLVTAFYSASPTCKAASGAPTDHAAVLFTTGKKISQEIYGVTAAATAVQALEHSFPATGADTSCPKLKETTQNPGATSFLNRTERPVILATSKTYTDSLASQYLAGTLTTGTLLTTPTSLTPVTRTALRVEGISHVYVMGGPLAIDTTVVNAIETMPVYRCGGNGLARNKLNQTGTIQVTRIGGATLYATAAMIAQTPPVSEVGSLRLPAAYAGGPTKHGLYNDTTGVGSTKVVSGGYLKTAILADGQEFQDAEAASVLAYTKEIPILLTMPTKLVTQAKTGLVALHVRQVIVMGGTMAITNTVVKSLEAMTITGHPLSVLRIGGKDYTDTAVQLAKMELNDTTTAGLDWDPTALLIARGNGFTDGIAGAVVENYIETATTSGTPAPMMLTENQTTVGTYLTTFLKTAGAGYDTATPPHTISHLVVLGGPLAVTPTIIAQMQALL